MTERGRVLLLIGIMASVSLLVAGAAIWILYRAAFEEERVRLVETAQSQARLIEAVARFDAMYSTGYPGGSYRATVSQIVEAHRTYEAYGNTGEFVLARRDGDSIVFLLRHRHAMVETPRPIAFDSELAEPMRRALRGESGTVVGLDYRGAIVLAAHEPVAELDAGIVVKIDLAEVQAPFRRAGYLVVGFTVLAVFAGSALFMRVTNPMIRDLKGYAGRLEKTVAVLRETEAQVRSTFAQAAVGMAHVSPGGRFIRVNRRLCDILGYAPDQLTKLGFWDITHPDDREAENDKARRLLAGEMESYATEKRYRGRDGSTVWGRQTVSVVRSDRGEPMYLIGVVEEITEQKRAEAEVARSLREKEVLLREIHHRVKNNMQAVSSMLNLQARKLDDPRLRRAFQESQSRVRAMALIHELLYQSGDLSGIDLQSYISGLVDSLLNMYQSAAEEVTFEVIADDIALGVDDTVPCGLIINELISNSLKYAFVDGQDARIRIEAKSSDEGDVSLVVCDNGVGLPADLDIRNTGTMGLRLVAGLAENQLGGTLEVDRRHGTCFSITFCRTRPTAGVDV